MRIAMQRFTALLFCAVMQIVLLCSSTMLEAHGGHDDHGGHEYRKGYRAGYRNGYHDDNWHHDHVYVSDNWYHPHHVYYYGGGYYPNVYAGYPYYYYTPQYYYDSNPAVSVNLQIGG
jgi:hypothetical protein